MTLRPCMCISLYRLELTEVMTRKDKQTFLWNSLQRQPDPSPAPASPALPPQGLRLQIEALEEAELDRLMQERIHRWTSRIAGKLQLETEHAGAS